MNLLVVGFDSAWTLGKSGALVGVIRNSDGSITELGTPQKATFSKALKIILEWQECFSPSESIIMIDQPTIVKNSTGQRPVENIVAAPVSLRRGGVQPANTSKDSMFGPSAPVWSFLQRFGGPADPFSPGHGTQVYETYPVLSTISLGWTLPDTRSTGRLPKYNPDRMKTFLPSDWEYLCDRVVEGMDTFGLKGLGGWVRESKHIKPNKALQNDLDACICLLVGLHFANGGSCIMVGDCQSGYMVVPDSDHLRDELEKRCRLTHRESGEWVRRLECHAFTGDLSQGAKLEVFSGHEDRTVSHSNIKKNHQDKIDSILREAYIQAAEVETEAILEDHEMRGEMGFCHIFWATQKRILKEKYGVNWKTPTEENPQALFD